jgi:MFS family permease
LLQTPLVATMALGSLSSGQIYARTRRARILMVTGALFLISGSLLVSQASISTPHWILALELALCGAGVGMNFPMIMIIVQSSVPRHRLGVGTSTVQFSRMMGSVLGTAVVGSLVSGIFLSSLTASVSRTHPMLLQLVQDPQVLVDPLLRMDAYTTASQLGAVGVANLYYLLQTSRDALGWGVQSSYLLTSIISVTVLLLSWQLGKIYQEQQHQHPAHQQHGQTQHGIAH